jgi:hypothetical protein
MNEAFRVRLYEADAENGLPGNVSFETIAVDRVREPTGLEIRGSGVSMADYMFKINLAMPMSLSASTPYWLEIAQLGESESTFVWEFSPVDPNGFAFRSPGDAEWQIASSGKSLAFQLSTIPEPGTLSLLALGGLALFRA